MNQDIIYWVWLSSLLQISPRKKIELIQYFKEPQYIWHSRNEDLKNLPFISESMFKQLTDPEPRKKVDKLIEIIYREDIHIYRYNYDKSYPDILYNMYDPPLILYSKGCINLNEMAVAIVGARKATSYGLKTAEKFAFELASYGITVISGMARGIDSQAHIGALKAGGKTIAVLGCGLDIVYPPENRQLMENIINNGAVVSEYPPGTQPLPYNFPARNRIISGLSHGVVVVEAASKSGSLITADFALEQGKEVFAVPGNINNINSRGTNKLIKEGAKLVSDVEDILEEIIEFSVQKIPEKKRKNLIYSSIYKELNTVEKSILKELKYEPLHIDRIAEKCNISIQDANVLLTTLELKGIIEQLPGKVFCISQ
ncbi:MAG TPA: DNA-protecting protein DprA [Clostridiaceae bacterium]|nr:DNA-protecting protein DprA [Clostridiaceae bacterium]